MRQRFREVNQGIIEWMDEHPWSIFPSVAYVVAWIAYSAWTIYQGPLNKSLSFAAGMVVGVLVVALFLWWISDSWDE